MDESKENADSEMNSKDSCDTNEKVTDNARDNGTGELTVDCDIQTAIVDNENALQ